MLESFHQERNLKKHVRKIYIVVTVIIIKYVQNLYLLSLYPVKTTYLVEKSRGLGWENQ